MKLLVVLLAALMFPATSTAASPPLGTQVDLTAAVSQLAGRPITIIIETELPGSWGGGAYPGMPYIYIGRDAYNDAQTGGGHGLLVLLHELGHTTGIHNEADANCFALDHLDSFLRAHWALETYDVWAHSFDPVTLRYATAVGFMHAQAPIYQCGRVAL